MDAQQLKAVTVDFFKRLIMARILKDEDLRLVEAQRDFWVSMADDGTNADRLLDKWNLLRPDLG